MFSALEYSSVKSLSYEFICSSSWLRTFCMIVVNVFLTNWASQKRRSKKASSLGTKYYKLSISQHCFLLLALAMAIDLPITANWPPNPLLQLIIHRYAKIFIEKCRYVVRYQP